MLKDIQADVREKVDVVRQTNKIALAKFLIPFGLAGATVIFFKLFMPEMLGKYATVFGIYSFVPIIGTVTVVPTGLGLGIHPIPLIAFIVYTDAILAMFLVWNFDYAKKIPGFGQLVERVGERGEQALQKYKWAKRLGFIGVVMFVIFPLQWTGAGVGSIVGRLIGMESLMTWLAVIIGTCIRSVILVYASWLFAFIFNLFLVAH
jgi:uncharacterized membrane protein